MPINRQSYRHVALTRLEAPGHRQAYSYYYQQPPHKKAGGKVLADVDVYINDENVPYTE